MVRGCSTSTNQSIINNQLIVGNRRAAGKIQINSNNSKSISVKVPEGLPTDYTFKLPNEIGSVDEVLKIDSVVGSEAICSWGSGGGSGIVNNRIDGDLTIGDDDSDLLVVNSDAKFVNNLQVPSIITLNTNSIISIGGPVSTAATAASSDNIALGYSALQSLTTGSHNIAVGRMASKYLTTGSKNIAIGNESQWGAVVGSNNVAMGLKSLMSNTYGSNNIAIGVETLTTNTSGNYNIATGTYALYSNTSGYSNVATGAQSLYLNTTGNNNVATGYQSLKSNTSGNYNIATGTYALYSNTTGIYNVAIGPISLYLNTTGSNNVAMGYQALFSTTGTGNTGIGYKAGYSITSGSYNVCIGYDSDVPTATGDKQLAISTSGLPNSIPWISGNSSGNVGIGTITPTAKLDVTGNTNISGNVNLKGDVVIGDDESDLLTIASKINVNGNEKILLDKPVLSDKGKIVTVNATGDNLEYGANFRELAFAQTIISTGKKITGYANLEKWLDFSSHNTTISGFNTDVSVTVAQGSKVKINCITGVCDSIGNGFFAFRLGKKVDGDVIWGSTNGISANRNDYQNDPKGDNEYSNKNHTGQNTSAVGANRIECWDWIYGDSIGLLQCVEPYFVDTDPTNGLSGTHNVTYFLRIRCEHPSGTNDFFYMNQDSDETPDNNRQICATILTVQELGLGTITSFTQEQSLAGAGGSAAFTTRVSSSVDAASSAQWVKENLHDNNVNDETLGTTWATDNTPPSGEGTAFSGGTGVCWISYEFNTPQIITKYRLWPRHEGGATRSSQNIRIWELRVATDFSSYNRSDSSTYTVLDSQSLTGALTIAGAKSDWKIDLCVSELSSSNSVASNNLHLSNEYNLSTIGAYKFYELYITANYDDSFVAITEWALYGGGFTIPSQIGNSGKQLITNGSSLSWGSPASILVPSPVSNAGKVLKANAAGTGLEYGTSGKILQIQQLFYKHEKEGTNNTPVAVTPAFKQTILLDSTSNYVSVLAQISISADSGRCPDCRLVSHTYSSESNMNNHTSPTTTILGEATSAHIPGDYGVTGWLGGSYINNVDTSNITREYIDLPGSLYVAYELYFCERRTNGTMWYLNRSRDVNVGDNDHNDTWGTCAISSMILKEFTNTPITTTTLE